MVTWLIIGGVIAFLLLLFFLLAVANYSGEKFDEKYKEMNRIEANTNLSPMQFITFLLNKYLKRDIEVVQISNVAEDAYGNGKLFLSGNTIRNKTLASFTIIAHEMGHAMQDVEGNKLKRFHRLKRIGRLLRFLLLPCLIAGIILLFFGETLFIVGLCFLGLGALIFIIALILKMMTISIEKDASKKAMKFLADIFDEKQLKLCKKFLNDARLTYWSDFLRILLFWTGFSKKTQLFN